MSTYRSRLDSRQAADYLGIGESTLRSYRASGTAPVHYKIGQRRIFYDITELDRWVDAQKNGSVQ